MPIHKVLFWSGFGVAVRLWQLGLEMRPLFSSSNIWVYPIYAGIGGSFGYWLQGVEQRQVTWLNQKRATLLEKRQRRAERDLQEARDTPLSRGEAGEVDPDAAGRASGVQLTAAEGRNMA